MPLIRNRGSHPSKLDSVSSYLSKLILLLCIFIVICIYYHGDIADGNPSYENRLCSLKTNEKEYHYSITIVSAQIYSIIFIYLKADGLLSQL